jgi:hypothetical protein
MDGEVHPLVAYAMLACLVFLTVSTVAHQLWAIYMVIWNVLRA